MAKYDTVFSPIKLGPVEISTRVYLGPHGNPLEMGGAPTEDFAEYYATRARAGVGLLIQSLPVSHRAGPGRACPSRDESVSAFAAVAQRVHEHGAKIFGQLNYFYDYPSHWEPLSPLAPNFSPSVMQRYYNYGVTRAMTADDVHAMNEAFARAARNLREAGYDGIEVHSTHGMLAEMFLSPYFNKRTDEYGGSVEGRAQYLVELLRAVRHACGPDMAVGMRFQCDEMLPGGLNADDCRELLSYIASLGIVDFVDLDVSVEPAQSNMSLPTHHLPQFFYKPFVDAVRAGAGDVPVLSTLGRVTAIADAERFLVEGTVDMVGIVRGFLAEPNLLANARAGRESDSRRCIGANMCQDRRSAGGFGCAINPASGRERLWGPNAPTPFVDPARVVVVGGGAAGLEAARVGAALGHQVVLFESDDRLGGQLNGWATLPKRELIGNVVDWYARQMTELQIDVRLGVAAGPEQVLAEDPAAVLIATGARYDRSGESGFLPTFIPGYDQPFVITPEDIFAGVVPSGRVLLLDDEGLSAGAGIAEVLARGGCEVTLVTRWSAPAHSLHGALEDGHIIRDLKHLGVAICSRSYVRRIEADAVTVYDIDTNRDERLARFDHVVLVTMRRPVDDLSAALEGKVGQIFPIGDALAPRGLPEATYEGQRFARLIGADGAPRTFTEAYWRPIDAAFAFQRAGTASPSRSKDAGTRGPAQPAARGTAGCASPSSQ